MVFPQGGISPNGSLQPHKPGLEWLWRNTGATLVEIKIKQLERSGKRLSEEERKELFESVKKTYDEQTDPRYGAARLWIDKIIDPVETREAITQALEAAALNPDVAEFKVGVLQT